MKRYVIATVVSVVIAALIGTYLHLDAAIRATSLLGLAPSYERLAWRHLEPEERPQLSDIRPFCGTSEIVGELEKRPEQMACIAFIPAARPCRPVASSSKTPDYVVPFFDEIEVNLVAVTDDIDGLAQFIDSYGQSSKDEEEIVSGDHYHNLGLAGHSKTILIKKCDGYGYLSIRQHYFED